MFKIKPLITFVAAFGLLYSINLWAADTSSNTQMVPPPPLKNTVLDSMVGSWSGDSHMMGRNMHDRLNISWALNHQFLIMKLKAKDASNPSMEYEGLGIFGMDKSGKVKSWWLDSWGAESVSTGEGSFAKNILTLNDGNNMFQETRSFEVAGDKMTMHAKGSMKWQGRDMPFDETTVYKKG